MTDRPPTPQETLKRAFDIAKPRLRYVYVGNIFIDGTEDTRCMKCNEVVVRRSGYEAHIRGEDGRCPKCGTRVKGVWK
jgi:pyruvate formate lyase activating enzyme